MCPVSAALFGTGDDRAPRPPFVPLFRSAVGLAPSLADFATNLGDELDEQGDPPRVWALDGDYPGCAFTRSFGDREGERIGVYAEPEFTVCRPPSPPRRARATDGSSRSVVETTRPMMLT